MVDLYGTPFTEALHVVERYRLLDYDATMKAIARDAKENVPVPQSGTMDCRPIQATGASGLQIQVTVEDDGAYAMLVVGDRHGSGARRRGTARRSWSAPTTS